MHATPCSRLRTSTHGCLVLVCGWDLGAQALLLLPTPRQQDQGSPSLAEPHSALAVPDSDLAVPDSDLAVSHARTHREQILGAEALQRVPEEFVTQDPHYANPPSLFLVLARMAEGLEGADARVRAGCA